MKRLVLATALALGSLFGFTASAGAVEGGDLTPSCDGVVEGADSGLLDKTLVSVVQNVDGSWTINYRVESDRAAGTDRFRDCVWFDTGAAGYSGEAFVGSTDERSATFLAQVDGTGSYILDSVTLPAGSTGTVCDRAARSGADAMGDYTDKSNTLCVPLTPTPPIPEVPFAALLPLAGLAIFGGIALRRRHQTAISAA